MVDKGSLEPVETGPGLLASMWRHRVVVAVVGVVAGFGAYVASASLPPEYEATAEVVLVDPESAAGVFEDGRRIDPARRLLKEAERMTSRAVLDAAAASVTVAGEAASARLGSAIDVNPSVERDLLSVTATARDPQLAADRANAVVAAYQQTVQAEAQAEAQAAATELEAAMAPIRERLDSLTALLAAAPDDAATRAQQEAALGQLVELETRARELAVNAAVYGSGVDYVEPALVPAAPSAPQPARDAALALFLAVGAASAWAWWKEGARSRAEEAEDPALVLDAPLLGQVPDFGPSRIQSWFNASTTPPLLSQPQVDEVGADAYQFVATSLEFALDEQDWKSVVFTSATPDQGKTITVINTAMAASADGRRVVLIDADGRKRSLTRLLGLDDARGLSDFVTTDVGLEDCLQPVDLGPYRLLVMPAGSRLRQPVGFFRLPQLRKALLRIQQDADLVLVDSPAVLPVADAIALAGHVDAIAAVVSRRAHQAELTALKERLALTTTPLLGYVFNRARVRDIPYRYATDDSPPPARRPRAPRRREPAGSVERQA